MTSINRFLLSCFALSLAACQTLPPVVLEPSLQTATELGQERPNNIAVLSVEDVTPSRSISAHAKGLRRRICRALAAERGYAPLAPDVVDARMRRAASGSVVDADFLRNLAKSYPEADALLGLRIVTWDQASIMEDARVSFLAEVQMLSRKTGKLLWGGELRGSVKAGGAGPAPLQRAAREAAAAEDFAVALIGQLPAREF